jgi:predicted Zn-dependent protease
MIALEIMGENSGHSLYLSTLYHLALNQFTHKKYSEAIASISKLTCAGCCDRCVYELKGRIYLADEKYSEALNEFETLRGMDPGYPLVYYYLGMTKISL